MRMRRVGVDAMTTDDMRKRLDQMVAEDANLRTLSYLIGQRAMMEWAHSVGVATDAGLAACVAPIPPIELRSIVADPNVALFLYTGFMDAAYACRLYEQYGEKGATQPVVLDFGCGCGRVMRFFDPDAWTVYGSEVNAGHVAWCNANLPGTRTFHNGYEPPLQFDDGIMDFAYTFSVFSHLGREAAAAWLAELSRVLKPGAIAVVTTHGYDALRIIAGSAEHQAMFRVTADEAVEISDRLASEGHIYLPFESDVLAMAHAGPSYGNTFVDPSYAKRAWSTDTLTVEAHLSGGMRGWQDVYVIKRK